jgi:hypothetical protein
MNPGRRFVGALDGLADRLVCVAGAVLFSQAPEFMQQYLQRLGGHLDEARRQLAQFEQTARQAGLTLDGLIARTTANADTAVARLGGVMSEAQDRVTALQAAHDALAGSSLWERPFVFVRHVDGAIARATWHAFQPAVPTTVEGLVYAAAGMLVLLAVYHLAFRLPVARIFRPAPRAAGSQPV